MQDFQRDNLESMTENAHKHALKLFDRAENAERMIKIYEAVINGVEDV